MEALDELRKMDDDELIALGNRQYGRDYRHNSIADAIEAEIAERYMLLPVDADGVPIRIGDTLEERHTDGETERFTVFGYTTEYSTWTADNLPLMATNESATEFYCNRCRHIKPRTIEDVLRDFELELIDVWKYSMDDDFPEKEDEIYAKYADEMRGIIGGE